MPMFHLFPDTPSYRLSLTTTSVLSLKPTLYLISKLSASASHKEVALLNLPPLICNCLHLITTSDTGVGGVQGGSLK